MKTSPVPRFPAAPAEAAPDPAKISVLVCEPSSIIRQGIRMALNALGIREITETSNFLAAHGACGAGGHQLLILNQEIETHDSTFLLREIRASSLGRDPFVLAVMLLASREEGRVRAAIDSGPDDLLLIPFAPENLTSRVKLLVERRKPFVVTHDYIGPDRRATARPGAPTATQFQVPNPARARGLGHQVERYARLRDDSRQAILVERIKRLAAAIAWECNALTVALRDGTLTAEGSYRALAKLDQITEELAQRVAETLGHATEGIGALQADIQRLKAQGGVLAVAEVEGLTLAGRKISATYAAR